MGGNAVRILATPVLDKSGILAFAQSIGIRLAAIGVPATASNRSKTEIPK